MLTNIGLDSFVSIDVETTGLDLKNDKIIEIAACRYKKGCLKETFQTLINPKIKISPFISNLTGIQNSQLKNKPIFLDKPNAYSKRELNQLLKMQKYKDQIFSCSGARFAKEIKLSKIEKKTIGKLLKIKCQGPKDTKKYLIHLVDPIVSNYCKKANFKKIKCIKKNNEVVTKVEWDNHLQTIFKTTGLSKTVISFSFIGVKSEITKIWKIPYMGFKKSLEYFVENMYKSNFSSQHNNYYKIVSIIEKANS